MSVLKTAQHKYIFNGRSYERFEDLPEEAQRLFADRNGNGIPDLVENLVNGSGEEIAELMERAQKVVTIETSATRVHPATESQGETPRPRTSPEHSRGRPTYEHGGSGLPAWFTPFLLGVLAGGLVVWLLLHFAA